MVIEIETVQEKKVETDSEIEIVEMIGMEDSLEELDLNQLIFATIVEIPDTGKIN